MFQFNNEKKQIIKQLQGLETDCKYNAETHHEIYKTTSFLMLATKIVPAILTFIFSVSEIFLRPNSDYLILLAAAAGLITAATHLISVNLNTQQHLMAAKQFTILKKQIRKTYLVDELIHDEHFLVSAYNTHLEKYNSIVAFAPTTSNKAFKKSQERIQEGLVHEPDEV